jgi:uncharacterized protein with WD repeat
MEVYSHITWKKLASCSPFATPANVVYEEKNGVFILSRDNYTSYIESDDLPEVSRPRFSPGNTYLSAVQGRSVQIYAIKTMKLLAVLFLKEKVKSLQWSPTEDKLLVTANNHNVSIKVLNRLLTIWLFLRKKFFEKKTNV